MTRLNSPVTLLVAFGIVGLLSSVNAYKKPHHSRRKVGPSNPLHVHGHPLHRFIFGNHGKQDGSEECDEWGRPLKEKQTNQMQDFKGQPQPQEFMKAFWEEIDQAFAKTYGWQDDWNLEELEKEMTRRMMSPSAAEEMKDMFINKQHEYRKMMEHRLAERREGKHAEPVPAYKLITIIVCSLMGVVFIMTVGVMMYKRKVLRSRSAVAPPTPEKIRKYMEQDEGIGGGKGPFPTCPAYMIAGAAPPVYTMADVPGEGGVYDNAPPTYSTIDLQDAAADVTVVNVKPM